MNSESKTATEVLKIPIKDIEASLFECREGSDLAELTRSIEKVGVIEPIIVRQKSDGKYELVAGGRRVSASRAAGLKEVPALVRELSDEEAFIFQASENLQRTDLTVEEKTKLVVYCAEKYKWKPKEIAQKLSVSPDWVYTYLPSQYKDQVKAEAGKVGGEVTQEKRVLDAIKQSQDTEFLGICEYHKVNEPVKHHTVNGEDHLLCDRYFNHTPLESVQGYLRTLTKEKNGELPKLPATVMKPRDFDTWTQRDAERKVQHSAMETKIVNKLRAKGYTVETDIPIVVVEVATTPDFNLSLNDGRWIRGYVDGDKTHGVKQADRDLELRELLRKKCPRDPIVAVRTKGDSDREADEKVAEILESLKWSA